MTDLFLELLSLLGIVVVSVILLVIGIIVLFIIAAAISAFVNICRGEKKKKEPYKTVTEIKEPGVYVATKDGIVKLKGDGEK
jgi:Na+-transporting methylmalonyl-CoA/oxaloacetate decarboxylase gamma subunit